MFFYEKGLVKEALSAYLEGISVNPEDEYIIYNISSLMYEKKNYVEVLKYINKYHKAQSGRFNLL